MENCVRDGRGWTRGVPVVAPVSGSSERKLDGCAGRGGGGLVFDFSIILPSNFTKTIVYSIEFLRIDNKN